MGLFNFQIKIVIYYRVKELLFIYENSYYCTKNDHFTWYTCLEMDQDKIERTNLEQPSIMNEVGQILINCVREEGDIVLFITIVLEILYNNVFFSLS